MMFNFGGLLILCSYMLLSVAHDIPPEQNNLILEETLLFDIIEFPLQRAQIEENWEVLNESRNMLFESLILALYEKFKDLDMQWIIKEMGFPRLIETGKWREKHLPIGVGHIVKNTPRKFNLGFCAMKRDHSIRAQRRLAGEIYGPVLTVEDFTLIELIAGNSQFLKEKRDSSFLCESVIRTSTQSFLLIADKSSTTPKQVADETWEALKDLESLTGCFSAMYAIINPENQIQIYNLGLSWAALYRDGQLLHQTHYQSPQDIRTQELCILPESPEVADMGATSDGIEYTWNSRPGDIFVATSGEVYENLSPQEILESFTLIKSLGPIASAFMDEDDFDLIAMGIAKAARTAANDLLVNDIFVTVVSIS